MVGIPIQFFLFKPRRFEILALHEVQPIQYEELV